MSDIKTFPTLAHWLFEHGAQADAHCVLVCNASTGHAGRYVALCESADHARYLANAANAHRDMLEALLAARAELEAYERERTGEQYNSVKINAAIAKATGSSCLTTSAHSTDRS